jgi:hypothetical protein
VVVVVVVVVVDEPGRQAWSDDQSRQCLCRVRARHDYLMVAGASGVLERPVDGLSGPKVVGGALETEMANATVPSVTPDLVSGRRAPLLLRTLLV